MAAWSNIVNKLWHIDEQERRIDKIEEATTTKNHETPLILKNGKCVWYPKLSNPRVHINNGIDKRLKWVAERAGTSQKLWVIILQVGQLKRWSINRCKKDWLREVRTTSACSSTRAKNTMDASCFYLGWQIDMLPTGFFICFWRMWRFWFRSCCAANLLTIGMLVDAFITQYLMRIS